jgi:hypothetical protein
VGVAHLSQVYNRLRWPYATLRYIYVSMIKSQVDKGKRGERNKETCCCSLSRCTGRIATYFRRNECPAYRDPMTFGSAPGLHLHTPHDDGLHEYWPHEQAFLLKISRYFEGREDLRDGFLIPEEFRGGEYLEGIGEGPRVSLRLPVVEDLLARASRTWPGTIFSIFNSAEPPESAPLSPIPQRSSKYQYISVQPYRLDSYISTGVKPNIHDQCIWD